MRYLKLFEAWVENPKFIRFSHDDLPEGEFSRSSKRTMIGPEMVNDELIKRGFPDKKNCLHFMSVEAMDLSMRNIWGKNVYEVKVDDSSIIGWTFLCNINDWYYKSKGYDRKKLIVQELEKNGYDDLYLDEDVSKMTDILLEVGAIGFGTIEDLKKSPWYGQLIYYGWTTDKVLLTKYEEPKKEPKVGTYKKERVLGREHFRDGQEMGKFYKQKGTEIEGLDLPSALDVLDEWRGENL
jgi:hypothetical protein